MDVTDILVAQLTEPFRIGLLVMLLVTAARTTQTVGTIVPLVLGVIFVAVLIPTSLGNDDGMTGTRIATGLVANTVILLVMLAAKAFFDRVVRPKG